VILNMFLEFRIEGNRNVAGVGVSEYTKKKEESVELITWLIYMVLFCCYTQRERERLPTSTSTSFCIN